MTKKTTDWSVETRSPTSLGSTQTTAGRECATLTTNFETY
jgi:hypothetical protein